MPGGERRHALVVGGTGMLAAATLAMARDYHVVSVIARNPHRLQDLAARAQRVPGEEAAAGSPVSGIINPIAVDYRDTPGPEGSPSARGTGVRSHPTGGLLDSQHCSGGSRRGGRVHGDP